MLSIGSAVGAGFTLIGRRFFSVVAWGFFLYLSILILFGIGFFAAGGPAEFSKLRALNTGGTADPQQVAQAVLGFFAALWPAFVLVGVGALVVGAMVQGAVYRSVLTPDQRSWFSLRLGGQEFALILLMLLLIAIELLAFAAPVAVLRGGIYLSMHGGGFLPALLAILFCVICAPVALWFATRFALAAPMTFAEGRVRFFGSWALTRGHGWGMYGLFWLLLLVIFAVGIGYLLINGVVSLITGVALAATISSSGGSQDPAAIGSHWPLLLALYSPGLILEAIFQGLNQAIAQAPWAEAYRQLKGAPDLSSTFS